MKKLSLILSILITGFLGQTVWSQNKDTVEYYTNSPDALLSSAVRVGNMLYLSGMTGRDPETRKFPADVETQTHNIMKNIKATLEKYGSSLDEVVKCTVFMANPDDRAALNKAYRSYFGDHPPARSGVGNLILSGGALVEIECMATVGLK
ncbi:MAG: RidA family protein [Kordiimonadaceae bacterium]|nr:RidA family protein [Kordiimonadaceae bacterium]